VTQWDRAGFWLADPWDWAALGPPASPVGYARQWQLMALGVGWALAAVAGRSRFVRQGNGSGPVWLAACSGTQVACPDPDLSDALVAVHRARGSRADACANLPDLVRGGWALLARGRVVAPPKPRPFGVAWMPQRTRTAVNGCGAQQRHSL